MYYPNTQKKMKKEHTIPLFSIFQKWRWRLFLSSCLFAALSLYIYSHSLLCCLSYIQCEAWKSFLFFFYSFILSTSSSKKKNFCLWQSSDDLLGFPLETCFASWGSIDKVCFNLFIFFRLTGPDFFLLFLVLGPINR